MKRINANTRTISNRILLKIYMQNMKKAGLSLKYVATGITQQFYFKYLKKKKKFLFKT